eukprot:SAG22_NODE_5291_length_1043_cov_1.546610_2_plen_109_part_00
MLSDAEARLFFGSLGTYLGRYRINPGPAVHKSKTSVVHFAKDLKGLNAVCCVKKMKNRLQFEAEINGRAIDGTRLSTEDVIGVIAWHTPEDQPFADEATGKLRLSSAL